MLHLVVLIGLHDTQDQFACYMKGMYTEHWEKAGRSTGSFSLAELAQVGQVEHFQWKLLCTSES